MTGQINRPELPLFDLDGLENVLVNGYDNVVLQFSDGRIERRSQIAGSNAELVQLLTRLGVPQGGGACHD